jgi:hypothetical protein
MLLLQLGITPDVTFISHPVINRYANLDEAVADTRPLFGDRWDGDLMTGMLREMLVPDGDELVFDGGSSVSGVAHWQPRVS